MPRGRATKLSVRLTSQERAILLSWQRTPTMRAAPARRAVVLDPFAGSGTVGLVARELGHDAVLVDLSSTYLSTIARERLGLAALQRWTNGDTPRVTSYADLPLFAED